MSEALGVMIPEIGQSAFRILKTHPELLMDFAHRDRFLPDNCLYIHQRCPTFSSNMYEPDHKHKKRVTAALHLFPFEKITKDQVALKEHERAILMSTFYDLTSNAININYSSVVAKLIFSIEDRHMLNFLTSERKLFQDLLDKEGEKRVQALQRRVDEDKDLGYIKQYFEYLRDYCAMDSIYRR